MYLESGLLLLSHINLTQIVIWQANTIYQKLPLRLLFNFKQIHIYPCTHFQNIQNIHIPQNSAKMSTNHNYNPYRIPFSSTIAQQHSNATTPGLPTQTDKLCPCCFMPVKRNQLRINFGVEDLRHLGYQYRWMYELGKIGAVVLGFVVFDSGLSQFQDILGHGAGADGGLFGYNWSSLSPLYPSEKFWLYSTLSFVSLIFLLILVRLWQTHSSRTLRASALGQFEQNYSILVKNIPKSDTPEQKIKDLFKTNFHNLFIKQILLIPTMSTYQQLKSQIDKQVDNWRLLLKNQNKKKQEILQTLKKIELCNQKFNAYKQELSIKKYQNFSGNAIVVFESTQNQKQVLKACQQKFFTKNKLQASFGQFIGDKQSIIIEEAPSPTQINWQNISLSNSQQNGKRRFNYILVVLCQVVFFMVYFCSQLVIGRKIGMFYGENTGTVCTLVLMSVLSYTFLPYIISKLQQREKSPTLTQTYTQTTYKLTISLVILRSFTILAAESVFSTGYPLANSTLNKILILTLSDLATILTLQVLNFHELLKRIQKLLWNNKNKLTQEQANNLFKKPTHNIPLKYSILMCTFITSIIYSNLIPVIIVIQLVTLFSFYWTDKINLARRSSVNFGRISTKYMEEIVQIMELVLIGKPMLNLIYYSISKQSVPIHEIVMFVLAVCYNIGPKQLLINKILTTLKFEYKDPNTIHDDKLIQNTYRIQSPISGGYQTKLQHIQNRHGSKLVINNQSVIQDTDITDTIRDRIGSNFGNQVPYNGNAKKNANEGNGGVFTDRRMNQLNDDNI